MAPSSTAVSNEQFLFSCIQHSTGGSTDFQKVADACGIPSKGAAYMRFNRMKAKFGTVDSAGTGGGDGDGETPKKAKAAGGKKAAGEKTATPRGKKRKVQSKDDDEGAGRGDRDVGKGSGETSNDIKAEVETKE